ncbi:MAG: DUF4138 domain-containing protein [Bacteroidia bacterium]
MRKLLLIFLLLISIPVLYAQHLNIDTVFANQKNTSYIILPKKVDLVDIGNPDEYAVQFQENSVFVKALVPKAGISTIFIKCGTEYSFGIIKFSENNRKFIYDFSKTVEPIRKTEVNPTTQTNKTSEISVESASDNKDTCGFDNKVRKFVKIKDEKATLGFLSSFIDVAVTVIRNDKDKTYLKVLIHNKASLPYNLEFISFQYFKDKQKGSLKKSKKQGNDVFPLYVPKEKNVPTLSTSALVYVIPSFALANNGYLMVIFREEQGDRVLKIKIHTNDLLGAPLLEDYLKNGKKST